jgi:hypothetical protein
MTEKIETRGRPKGKLTAGSMRGVIPSMRCHMELEAWLICESERRGVSRADLIREVLEEAMSGAMEQMQSGTQWEPVGEIDTSPEHA